MGSGLHLNYNRKKNNCANLFRLESDVKFNQNLKERAIANWEYCAIYGVKWNSDGWGAPDDRRAAQFFKPDGAQSELGGWKDPAEIAKKIAQLDAEGWEMVCAAYLEKDTHALYFKRHL
jgi:hypothetical protein